RDEEDGVGYTLENILFLEGDWTNKEVPASYITGTKSTVGTGRLQSTDDKGNVIGELYYIAKDKDGNIIWLRSVPSANDEINVTRVKAIKRTKKVNLWELNWIIHGDSHTENFYGLRVSPYFSDAIVVQDTPNWILK